MTHPFYQFTTSAETSRFEFISIGHSVIRKVIIYQELPFPNGYNLALGDLDKEGKADFEIISDNGDRDLILATVIQTLMTFFGRYPQVAVFIAGSTPSRTRLYQGVIARELTEIQKRFNVTGITDMGTEPFTKGNSYSSFVISLKWV